MTVINDSTDSTIYAIAKCLNEIIVNPDFNLSLQKVVNWLADSLEIDRCFISESGNSKMYLSFFSQNTEKDNFQRQQYDQVILNSELFPEIHSILIDNRSFKVSINNKVSAKLQHWLQTANLQSLLLIPVFRGNKFWGCIGFGDSKNTRTWHNSEFQLHSLANAIGSALESQSIKNELERKNGDVSIIGSSINEIVWKVDLIENTSKVSGSKNFIQSLRNSVSSDNILDWFDKLMHVDDKERVKKKIMSFLADKDSYAEEDVYRLYNKKSSRYYWMHSRYKVRRNEEGVAISITGNSVDISETKEVGFELSKQREQYEFLVESLGQIVFTLDTNGNLLFASSSIEDISGYNINDLKARPLIDLFSEEYRGLLKDDLQKLLSANLMIVDKRVRLINSSGETIWVRIMLKTTYNFNNEPDGFFGILENIHEKYNAELLLRDTNEQINSILNNSKEIIITIDLEDNRVVNVNRAISILDYTPADFINSTYKDWPPNQQKKFLELMKLAVQSELQVKNQRIDLYNKTNSRFIPFEFSTSIFYIKNTKYLMCVLRDISERLIYEENLKHISNQLTHLINNIDDVYAIYNLKTNAYDFVSDNIENLFGCDKKLFYNDTEFWKSRIVNEDAKSVVTEVAKIVANKTKGQIFYRINSMQGEQKMILEKLVVSVDKDGEADKLYIVKTDYTNIENAEKSLIETQRKFQFISENLSDFISIHDPDWNFTYASPSVKNILGFEPSEILGLGGFDLVHADDLQAILDNSLNPIVLEKKETQFRYRMVSKDGGYKWVETYAKPVINTKGEISSIICSTRDVTDQINAENRLKESEEQYRLISENSNDLIGIHNLDKEFIYVSPSCKQVLGYDAEELIGKKPQDVYLKKEPDGTSVINEANEVIRQKKERKYISAIITKTGEEKLLEVWLKPIFKGDELVALQSASRDVTEREKLLNELEQSLEKERELNELRAKFVSTASHQFRTPLTVIQSGVEIMEMYIEDLPQEKKKKFQKQFIKLQEEIDRLSYLMNDVLLLGRANAGRTPYEPIKGNLVNFCKSILENKYNNLYPPDRQVVLSVSGNEVPVLFDPKLLDHVVENILNNGYKYSTKGNLSLQIVFEDKCVKLILTDQGIGIPEDDIKNMFQPFYRAKNTYEFEGTGLGLSIVKEFVEKHGGNIYLTSELNKGTTVSVILPIE